MYPFKEIRYEPMGQLPAAVDINTGVLSLNETLWPQLSEPLQRFILLHEKSHYLNQSTSESEADKSAISEFLDHSSPENFAQSLGDLTGILKLIDSATPEQKAVARQLSMTNTMINPHRPAWITAVIAAVLAVVEIGVAEYDKDQKDKKNVSKTATDFKALQDEIRKEEQKQQQAAESKPLTYIFIIAGILIFLVLIWPKKRS